MTRTPRSAARDGDRQINRLVSLVSGLFLAAIASQPAFGANFTSGSDKAVKFGTHEIVLTGNGTVKNPFDIVATVQFMPPSGARNTVTVRAFYDGGNIWRARLYVTETGQWKWASRSATHPVLNGKTGTFTAGPSNLPGILKLHPANPKAWITDSGKPFISISDTAWLLFNPESKLWQQYVKDDAARGITVLGPVGSLESWGTGDVAHKGDNNPWVEKDTTDYTRYDLAKFQNADSRIIWIFNHYPGMYIQSMLFGTQVQSSWGRLPQSVRNNTLDYMIARWSAFPNLFWLVSEDQDTNQNATLAFNREVGHYLATHEPWRHLKSTQPNRFQGFPFTTAEDWKWVDYVHVQDSNGLGAEQIQKYKLGAVPRQVQLGEDYYEQDYGQPPSRWADPAYYVRWSMWSWILSGGAANYGGRYGVVHPYSQTGRKDLVWVGPGGNNYAGHQLHGLDATAHIAPYFQKRNLDLALFRPDDALVSDFGRRPGYEWRPKLMRRRVDEFLVYHPNAASEGDSAKVNPSATAKMSIDLSAAPGTFELEWYRPADGEVQTKGTVKGGGVRAFTSPWKGVDVVLRLAKRSAEPDALRAAADLASQLRDLDGRVFPADSDQAKQLPRMLADDVRARLQAANRRDREEWQEIKSKDDWERFRDPRLEALRRSLGQYPPIPRELKVRVTRTIEGDGYQIENIVFESRPGLVVTANVYQPTKPRDSMPGILICHSHHNPKTQGELQDMGMTWARLGCLVLVMDQLGHGERRQHPFRDQKSYAGSFRTGRQDYYFRYNVGMQLHVIGDSLIGWMAWDLSRGVDLLLARPGIDKKRVVLLGAVAGGGDPAAVTTALDPRITAVVPFNFGGPQPETRYPLPPDAETSFNYAGRGHWESTRNLRLSARDGFLPWVIVGSVAPRGLVYAHEFAWDRERDPVWARLQKTYGFYDAADRLAFAHGRGKLSGQPPESTHCNNIGPEHRKGIYAALKRWFDIAVPEKEARERRSEEELTCLTPNVAAAFKPRLANELVADLGAERIAAARARLAKLTPAAQCDRLRKEWTQLLGDVEPATAKVSFQDSRVTSRLIIERIALQVEPGIVVPSLLLRPPAKADQRLPVVVAIAQGGKQEFLRQRSQEIAGLLQKGMAVCLPDLRGTGETRPGDGRGGNSAATDISSSELMLGQTLVGSRLRDLRMVLRYLRSRKELDASRLGLWGDSFAPVNPSDRNLVVPLDAGQIVDHAEPLGGLLAMFGGLFEEDVRAVYVRGGLVGYHSLLQSQFVYVPHDAVVPGVLTAGDLSDVAAALAPRPLRLDGLVDGLNRQLSAETVAELYDSARAAYRAAGAGTRFHVGTRPKHDDVVPFFVAAFANAK